MDNGRGRRTSLRIGMVADRRLWASSLISHVSLSLVHPQRITPVAHQPLFRQHVLLQPLVWLKWSSSPSLPPNPEAPLIPPHAGRQTPFGDRRFFLLKSRVTQKHIPFRCEVFGNSPCDRWCVSALQLRSGVRISAMF